METPCTFPNKKREKYLGKFFEHLPFKEAKCRNEGKEKTLMYCTKNTAEPQPRRIIYGKVVNFGL